jgi:galactokinase
MASANMPGEATCDPRDPKLDDQPRWCRYVAGVLALMTRTGWEIPPLDLWIESDVPTGSGLSSSAALEVATATLVEAVAGRAMDPVDRALLCRQAEHEYAGVPCGIMDQFTSAMAKKDHLLLLDCRSRETRWIPLDAPEVAVLIADTNVKHALVEGGYARRQLECRAAAAALGVAELRDATMPMLQARRRDMDEVVFRRARHVVTENQRVLDTAQALPAGEWERVAQSMHQSHESLRDDYQVSCPELDLMVALARRIGPGGGVLGSRMTGGGFGGCTVHLVAASRARSIAEQLARHYQSETGIPATIFLTRPADGAGAMPI